MIVLKANTFYLNDDAIYWVNETIGEMTTEEKIGQLFCSFGLSDGEAYIQLLTKQLAVGGVMYRPGDGKPVQKAHRTLQ